jgi:hypothetical protein
MTQGRNFETESQQQGETVPDSEEGETQYKRKEEGSEEIEEDKLLLPWFIFFQTDRQLFRNFDKILPNRKIFT